MIIKKFNAMSVAKVSGLLYALLGLLLGAFFALISLVGSGTAAMAAKSGKPLMGLLFGVGAVVALPLFYGGLGFVMGYLFAVLYNWVAQMAGGLQIEVEDNPATDSL